MLKKEYRVTKKETFSKVIKKKQQVANKCFVLYYQPSTSLRVGISVSKKLGNAVVRNKIKRQVRQMVYEVFDLNGSYDFILIVRFPYLKQNYAKNKKDLELLYKQVKMKE